MAVNFVVLLMCTLKSASKNTFVQLSNRQQKISKLTLSVCIHLSGGTGSTTPQGGASAVDRVVTGSGQVSDVGQSVKGGGLLSCAQKGNPEQ